MNSNAVNIEVSVLYNRIKEMTDPKEVLEALSEMTAEMGWIPDENARAGAYAVWLHETDRLEWYEFMKGVLKFFQGLSLGTIIPPGDPPEDWIDPIPYIKGEIPEVNEDKK